MTLARSRTAGRLKADVCIEVAERLQALSINHIAGLCDRVDDPEVRQAWTGVHGLGWLTWQYFCSLAGIDHLTPDVMLMRFAADTLGRNIGPAETDATLSAAVTLLQSTYPQLTKRVLDRTIWRVQRSDDTAWPLWDGSASPAVGNSKQRHPAANRGDHGERAAARPARA